MALSVIQSALQTCNTNTRTQTSSTLITIIINMIVHTRVHIHIHMIACTRTGNTNKEHTHHTHTHMTACTCTSHTNKEHTFTHMAKYIGEKRAYWYQKVSFKDQF